MKDVRGTLKLIPFVLVIGVAVLAGGCLPTGDSVTEGETNIDIEPTEVLDPSTVVCDPFEGGTTPLPETQGVLAHLSYLTPDQPRYDTVVDYLQYGHSVDEVNLFFNKIDIPTRPFDRGFVTQSGSVIQTPQGDTLYEYFSMSFKGQIHLGEGNAPGLYQFAMLADDGAVLRMKSSDGSFVTVVDNDGTHGTRLGCGTEPVYIGSGQKIPFELDYYQGPRYHIALVVMWRPWPSDDMVNDPLCGRVGNSLFFDSTQEPPAPQQAYLDLLDRGWRVLETDNYSLPEDAGPSTNPCNAPAPVIANFTLTNVTSTTATLSWITDIPSTSQLYFKNEITGVEDFSEVDNQLVTNHQITLTGLTPNSVYTVRAISHSSSGLSAESNDLTVRTRR